jgi:uncharacterized coiled-coil DUF342 family protein|tara:strand:- start:608 stop:823 length:216 start_codon:yes stop_codon:yes gene_type:complete
MIHREEYDAIMTKLKKVQKENDLLRNQVDMVQREADYWEYQAKAHEKSRIELEKDYMQLQAQLKLWQGTAP